MLADDIAAALPGFRAQAEALMVDTVRIERQTGTDEDPDTLEVVPVYETIYEGPCRVQRYQGNTNRQPVIGGVEVGIDAVLLQVPLSARGVRRGDRASIVAVGVESDPEMLGQALSVMSDLTKTHASKRTLACQEVVSNV